MVGTITSTVTITVTIANPLPATIIILGGLGKDSLFSFGFGVYISYYVIKKAAALSLCILRFWSLDS